MNKIKFYRRIRDTIIVMKEKSNDRIISDCMMVSPLVNDKGILVKDNNINKYNLSKVRNTRFRRNVTRNK